MFKFLSAAVCAMIISVVGNSATLAQFNVQCVLNDDKSSVLTIAANATDQSYSCAADCHIKISGQRYFMSNVCQFRLSSNMEQRVVCEIPGDGPGYFEIAKPEYLQCTRN